MRHRAPTLNVLALSLLVCVCVTMMAWSQNPPSSAFPRPRNDSALNLDAGLDPDIPRAALLTEKGMQMAAKLKMLRQAESRLGKKHPSLPEIQRQIAQIRTELREWVEEPAKRDEAGNPVARELSKSELQEIVFRLAEEVDLLKQRVARLEAGR